MNATNDTPLASMTFDQLQALVKPVWEDQEDEPKDPIEVCKYITPSNYC